MCRNQCRATRGFTLIELLVVVAIIALLISILLPSLSQAREQAKRTKCGTYMKSIGTAVQTCYASNKEYGPTWDDGEALSGERFMYTWVDVLFDLDFLSDAAAGVCPNDQRPDFPAQYRGANWGNFRFVRKQGVKDQPRDGVRTSYALNAIMHFNFPEDRFNNPARQLYAMDGWWTWFGSANATWALAGSVFPKVPPPLGLPHDWGTMVGWRHGKEIGANALFRDGHVEYVVPRKPKDKEELFLKTVDTVRMFTWLPGEHSSRRYFDSYDEETSGFENKERITEYDGRLPAWFTTRQSGGGKKYTSADNIVPYAFPDELSATWRTQNRVWRKLPSDPSKRN